VELGGSGKLHAPFLTERRTRGIDQRIVAGNPGTRSGRDENFVAKLGAALRNNRFQDEFSSRPEES
jgi:hypothetical protein